MGDSEAGCWGLRWVTCDRIPSLVTQSSLLLPLEAVSWIVGDLAVPSCSGVSLGVGNRELPKELGFI